eukprot:GHVR01003813.1.p2 GENE.GHVR01003813.1~~GHVR01003813.1.p2  ORF type:complete len:101 (+),score=12.12 GHVR01003813.1:282-584(+)
MAGAGRDECGSAQPPRQKMFIMGKGVGAGDHIGDEVLVKTGEALGEMRQDLPAFFRPDRPVFIRIGVFHLVHTGAEFEAGVTNRRQNVSVGCPACFQNDG